MDKHELQQLQENWDALLDSEGLGVIDPQRNWDDASKDIKHIKGKHKRLDAMLNDPDPSGRMTNSPVTAKAVETRFANAEDEQSDFDDGLWDDDEDADNAWDLMVLSFIATPKEAEIADRRRAAVYGLDEKNRPRSGKVYRKKTDTDEQYAERVAERLGIATDEMGPPYSPWSPPKPAHAHTYAGGGPLAMVDRPKPDYGNRRDDDVRMSPVVDTEGYPSGRSPYQMSISRSGRHNSDITG